jgi:hypothetical protein
MAVPQIVVWKIMLAKPVVGLGKNKKDQPRKNKQTAAYLHF